MKVLVKICGITNEEDADLCKDADFLGFILVESSPRLCSPDVARKIKIPKEKKVVVLKDSPWNYIESFLDIADWFQLHGYESKDIVLKLKRAGKKVIKAVFPEDEKSVELAKKMSDVVDLFLVDSLKKYRTMQSSRAEGTDRIVQNGKIFGKDFLLSGGLTPENVCNMIKKFRPFGVDVASGVEIKPGKKSPELVRSFLEKARGCSV